MNTEETKKDGIWVISDGSTADLDISKIYDGQVSGPVIEYKISELAFYLLNPNQIQLDERVIGCKVNYRKPRAGFLKRLGKMFKKKNGKTDNDESFTEEIITSSKTGTPTFLDEDFNAHCIKINEMLRPYDPVQKKLTTLDKQKVKDITAICKEVGGHQYTLKLQGSLDEKINFMVGALSQKAKVVFGKSYLSNGLFEMRAFQFDLFRADNSYRLIKFSGDNQVRLCVLNSKNRLEFWLDDIELINYMHVFEQSIKADPKLREVINLCVSGGATPLKLFFTKQLEHGYSEKRLPMLYREVFNSDEIKPKEKEEIINILNGYQGVVFFNYLVPAEKEKQKIYTNISVMHDTKALEPIKRQLPLLYSEIEKKTSMSAVGKLYLLDSMREHQNV